MPEELVVARGLVKIHGRGRAARRVLDGVDIDLRPGELVALVGPSGSGKSTLLHLIGGLDKPDGGRLTVSGIRLESARERTLADLRRHHIGFVFQFFHLIPELTGEENVQLAARVNGRNGAGRRRAERLIDELGLAHLGRSRPHELSGGEQQRFALARALVNDPSLILADEPTGNLDTEAGAQVLALLRALATEGRAVLLVTHDHAATASADRVLNLKDGRLG
ncbi:MAG: ABC transporter ATP-binding protein [Thermoleophilaceae bacterium]